jgi:hypothetical protein
VILSVYSSLEGSNSPVSEVFQNDGDDIVIGKPWQDAFDDGVDSYYGCNGAIENKTHGLE